MQITSEMKAQFDEQKKQCIYCKIVSNEISGKTVFQDKVTQAIIDIYPARKGHVVFFLKEHYPIMPYIPGDEFKHFFGIVPQLSKAIKSGTVTTGINIFIANGWVAGQQFPHVLIHMLPREASDNFFNYAFDKRDKTLQEEQANILSNNFPIMMSNHFGRHPNNWHQGKGNIPSYLTKIYEKNKVIYEDEKVLCVIPTKGVVKGHLEIYSKIEEKHFENLSITDSEHLFFTASLASTLVFEGLQLGQEGGTNIVLKSGESDDNPDGKLSIHIIPRKKDDGLNKLSWEPKQPKHNLDEIFKKIKDKTWKIKYESFIPQKTIEEPKSFSSADEEIKKAIETLQ